MPRAPVDEDEDDDGEEEEVVPAVRAASRARRGRERASREQLDGGVDRPQRASKRGRGERLYAEGDADDIVDGEELLEPQEKSARVDPSTWYKLGDVVEIADGHAWRPGTVTSVENGGHEVVVKPHEQEEDVSGGGKERMEPRISGDTAGIRPSRPGNESRSLSLYKSADRVEVWRDGAWWRAEVLQADPQRVVTRSPDTEEQLIVKGSDDIRPERIWDGNGRWRAASKKRPYFDDQDPYIKVEAECAQCRSQMGRRRLVKCSSCPRHYHLECLDPPLNEQPPKPWNCPQCMHEQADSQADEIVRTRGNIDAVLGQRQSAGGSLEFLVKYEGRAYKDAEWLSERAVRALADRKLKAFWRKHGMDGCSPNIPADFYKVDRVILADDSEEGERMLLVKWQSLGYDQSTWEHESEVRSLSNGPEEIAAYEWRAKQPKQHPPVSKRNARKRYNDQPQVLRDAGKLHDHQLEGLNWLLSKLQRREGAILGDEMGLGKTIQAGAMLACSYAEMLICHPTLIVAPLSTLSSWNKELKQWCSLLNMVVYIGTAESRQLIRQLELSRDAPRLDILLTSYEVANQDSWLLNKYRWSAIIVDEGHRLKSSDSKLSQMLTSLKAEFRLILTGTPLQNNLEELFALLHFIDPQRYGDPQALAQAFTRAQQRGDAGEYEDAKENIKNEARKAKKKKGGNEPDITDLHALLQKHMLRRLKREVLPDMPVKRKREVHCGLSSLQQSLYADVLAKNHKAVNLFNTSNKRVSLINILKELQKVCNHPFLFPGVEPEAKKAEEGKSLLIEASGKLVLLSKLLPPLRERGHKALLFCQMTQMLDVLEDFMIEMGLPYCRIDGTTASKERQQIIDRFNAEDSDLFIFLISTRAGGLGINLPSADTVFIYDPDFNPFVDLQAQGRAHRIGQRREVMVYQLVTDGTVEEQILDKAKKKLAIERLVVRDRGSDSIRADELRGVLTHGAVNLLSNARNASEQGLSGNTRTYATDQIIDTLLDRENAPIVEDDVESQGYLGSVEAENKEQVEPTSNGQEETPEESTALEQLLQERNAIIEEQQAKAMGRGKRERRSKFYNLSTTEEANEAGKPEGQNIVLEEEDFLDEDAVDPGGPKQTQGPDTDYQPARVPIAPRVTEDEQGEEGQSENLKSSAKATFGHLPWVKELSQSQVDDLKALVKSHGDAAARNQSRGNSSKSGAKAHAMSSYERRALQSLGVNPEYMVTAEPINYFPYPMDAPRVANSSILEYPKIPFATPVNFQNVQDEDMASGEGQQDMPLEREETPESWGARNFKEVVPNMFIWQQAQKGVRVTKSAVVTALKNIARYQNYRWRLLEDTDDQGDEQQGAIGATNNGVDDKEPTPTGKQDADTEPASANCAGDQKLPAE